MLLVGCVFLVQILALDCAQYVLVTASRCSAVVSSGFLGGPASVAFSRQSALANSQRLVHYIAAFRGPRSIAQPEFMPDFVHRRGQQVEMTRWRAVWIGVKQGL